jgi:hypothetical protein
MVSGPSTKPVEDSVAKVNDEIAVGEDLEFQRKWWRFEKIAWIFFALIIVLDLAGLFGRGPLARARRHAADATIDVRYGALSEQIRPPFLRFSSHNRPFTTEKLGFSSATAW